MQLFVELPGFSDIFCALPTDHHLNTMKAPKLPQSCVLATYKYLIKYEVGDL